MMKYVFILLALLFGAGTEAAVEFDEVEALAVLQKLDVAKATDAELFDAATACRRLTVVGTEKAVSVLEPLLVDPKLGSYARTALQNIKLPEAEAVLKKHPAKTNNASPVDEKLLKADLGKYVILKGDEESLDLFVGLLKSDDRTVFNVALTALREFPNRKIVDVLAKEQVGLEPARRVAAILSLLDRNDVMPMPTEIVEAAKSDPNAEVQAAAIAVLGKFPDETIVDLLLSLFRTEKSEQLFDTLKKTLATMKSTTLDDRLIAMIRGKNNDDIMLGCFLACDRFLDRAGEDVWRIIQESDLEDREILYGSYGQIADRAGFGKLLEEYSRYPYEKLLEDYIRDPAVRSDTGFIYMGLLECCKRSADRNGYAEQLAAKLPPSPFLLHLLEALGGDEALKQVADIARKADKDEIRDKATKILGEWTGAEVAPVLLSLSASLKEEKYKVRTLRGFLRAVRQFEMPKDEKKKLCEKALGIADREEEKKLIRDVLSKL